MYIDRCSSKQKIVLNNIGKAQRIAMGGQRVEIPGWHIGMGWGKSCKLLDQKLKHYILETAHNTGVPRVMMGLHQDKPTEGQKCV